MQFTAVRSGLSIRQTRAFPLGFVQDFIACYLIAECGWTHKRPKATGSLFDQMAAYYG